MNSVQEDNQLTPKASVKTLKWFFVLVAVSTLILSGSLYFVLNSSARQALVRQMHLREESVSKTGANSISTFLKLYGKSLVLLADNPEIISRGAKFQETLNSFVEIWKDTPINGVLLVDKDGKVSLFSSKIGVNILTETTSVSDRDYFIWVSKAKKGEVFMGDPIIPRVGNLGKQYIIPVATPIYKEGVFDGLLVSAILLKDLTKEYLDPLKMSADTNVYLANSTGTLLYGPFENLIGQNYIKYLENHPFLGSTVITSYLKERIKNSTEAGKMDIVLPDEKRGKLTRFLIAYTPIFYNHNHLILAIAVPADEALTYIAPVYINQLGALLAGFLAIFLLTIVFIRFRRCRKRTD